MIWLRYNVTDINSCYAGISDAADQAQENADQFERDAQGVVDDIEEVFDDAADRVQSAAQGAADIAANFANSLQSGLLTRCHVLQQSFVLLSHTVCSLTDLTAFPALYICQVQMLCSPQAGKLLADSFRPLIVKTHAVLSLLRNMLCLLLSMAVSGVCTLQSPSDIVICLVLKQEASSDQAVLSLQRVPSQDLHTRHSHCPHWSRTRMKASLGGSPLPRSSPTTSSCGSWNALRV